jgi:hypothetical protein
VRKLPFLILLAATPSLGGCAASIAASALGAAIQSGQSDTPANVQAGVDACYARANALGRAKIIDVERRSVSKITVWGSVENETGKQSFECGYSDKITGFKLRAVTPR